MLVDEIGRHAQGTRAAGCMRSSGTARRFHFMPFAKHQLLHGGRIRRRAWNRQIRHRLLPLQHQLARFMNRFQNRRFARVVLVNADAQIDLLRIGILPKRLGESQNGIRRGGLD